MAEAEITCVDDLIVRLVGMGFDIEECRQAVESGKLTVSEAVEWLLGNREQLSSTTGPRLQLRQQSSLTTEVSDASMSHMDTNETEQEVVTVVSRSYMSEEQRRVKERFEEKQRLEAKKLAREEKRLQERAHQTALKQIEEDRDKQKIRSKSHSQSMNIQSVPPSSSAQRSILHDTTVLQIRLLDGTMLRHTFQTTATILDVCNLIEQEKKLDMTNFCLVQPFPHHQFCSEEMRSTLSELKLVPNGSLVLRRAEVKTETGDNEPGQYNFSLYRRADPQEDESPTTNVPPPSHVWGTGQRLADEQESYSPMIVEASDNVGDPENNLAVNPNPNPVFQEMMQPHAFPQNAFQAMMDHQLDTAFSGEGQVLSHNAQVHHSKAARELARQAAFERIAVPASCDPDPGFTRNIHVQDVASLMTICMKLIVVHLVDPRGPQLSLHGLPADIASKLINYLIKEKLLRPKTLHPFISCHLRSLVLDFYAYTTNELLASVRYHSNLVQLSLVSCSLMTDKGLESLTLLPKLRVLNLSGCHQITNKCFQFLKELKHLSNLNLEATKVTDAGLKEYTEAKPTELQQLNLNRTSISHYVFQYFQELPKLRSLSLEHTKINQLNGVQNLKCLQSLNLANTEIITDSLLCLTSLPILTSLSISHTPCIDGDRALEYVAGLSLQTLQLPRPSCTTSVGLQFIADMPLQSLDLTNYFCIGDDGIQHLGRIISLKKLLLSNTKVTDIGMMFLEGLINLEVLYLDRTAVTDDGIRIIKAFRQLVELSLAETRVTSKFLLAGSVNSCILMSKLNLSSTNVSTRGVLNIFLPNLTILNLDGTRVCPGMLTTMPGCPLLQKISMRDVRPVNSDDDSS